MRVIGKAFGVKLAIGSCPLRAATPGACGSADFLLHVAVADNQELYAFVIDKLTERPEVADVRTSVIYEHLRNHAVAPAARP